MQTESASVNTAATILQGTTAETPPAMPIIVPELPKIAFAPLAEEPLKSVVQTAGMVWVGTDSNKLAEVQNQIQSENPAPRVQRDPKPPANLPTGPMVLVETGGQEKTIDKNG
jgi:ribonuclease E